jgi:hypothetical protein
MKRRQSDMAIQLRAGAVAAALCAAGPQDRAKDHAKPVHPERTPHATKPAATTRLLRAASDDRDALIAHHVGAIVEGMRAAQSARKMAAIEQEW